MRYRYFMHYTEGSFMPFLVLQMVMDNIRNAPVPFFIKPITRMIASKVEESFLSANLTAQFEFLENQLKTAPGGGPFLCGKEVTAADIMMGFPLIAASVKLSIIDKYPMIAAYVERVQEVDGYKRAAAKIEEAEGSFTAYK